MTPIHASLPRRSYTQYRSTSKRLAPVFATEAKRQKTQKNAEGMKLRGQSSQHTPDNEDDDKLSEKSSSAKNPGLKIISRQVLDAVKKNASTTYKDVANIVSK